MIFSISYTPGQSCAKLRVRIHQRGDVVKGFRHLSLSLYANRLRAARKDVKIQAALGAEIVCSGHGPIVREAAGKFPI
jgi:hypothetical protein